MRVHSNQVNPNAQLDEMYAEQKAAAKQEAERTRKKLTEFASKLAGEAGSEDCVVKLEEREGSHQEKERQDDPDPHNPQEQAQPQPADSSPTQDIISDWV